MKLLSLKKILDARTKGGWWAEGYIVEHSKAKIADCVGAIIDRPEEEALANAEFIAAMANHAEELLDVVAIAIFIHEKLALWAMTRDEDAVKGAFELLDDAIKKLEAK